MWNATALSRIWSLLLSPFPMMITITLYVSTCMYRTFTSTLMRWEPKNKCVIYISTPNWRIFFLILKTKGLMPMTFGLLAIKHKMFLFNNNNCNVIKAIFLVIPNTTRNFGFFWSKFNNCNIFQVSLISLWKFYPFLTPAFGKHTIPFHIY